MQLVEQRFRSVHDDGGAVFQQEIPTPETPRHRQAGETSIGCRLDVHVRVSHIDALVWTDVQLSDAQVHQVPGGFFLCTGTFTDGDREEVPKMLPTELLHSTVEFIGYHCYFTAIVPQGSEQ